MGFNNGYESGYEDAKAEFASVKAGLEKRIAELESGSGSGGGGSGMLDIGWSLSAIEGSDESYALEMDLSGLQVGQVAYIHNTDPTLYAGDPNIMMTRVTAPVGVTSVDLATSFYNESEGSHVRPKAASLGDGRFIFGYEVNGIIFTTLVGTYYPAEAIAVRLSDTRILICPVYAVDM